MLVIHRNKPIADPLIHLNKQNLEKITRMITACAPVSLLRECQASLHVTPFGGSKVVPKAASIDCSIAKHGLGSTTHGATFAMNR